MSNSQQRKWKTLREDLDPPCEDPDPSPAEPEVGEASGPVGVEMSVPPEPEPSNPVPEAGHPNAHEPREESPDSVVPSSGREPDRVLVIQSAAATTRLIRETLENFTEAEVVTTSDPLRGFELALQKEYRLFLFGMQVGELSGPMLYELISKTYSSGWAPARLAPGVVFIRGEEDPPPPEELSRDVRVKDVIRKPVRIDRLLRAIEPSIEVLDPTSRS